MSMETDCNDVSPVIDVAPRPVRGRVARFRLEKDVESMSPLERAVVFLGGYTPTARICGVTFMTVGRWVKRGRLPRTELSGETSYAAKIERALEGKITEEELLSSCFPNWRKSPKNSSEL